jgi:hemerythrin
VAHQINNKMKTAMQELIEQLQYHFANESRGDFFDASKYLKKEKEQIIDAHINGQSDHHFSLESRTAEAEEYYNKIINKNK